MQDAIISIPTPPATTLSIDAQVFMGQNRIRRNIGTYTTLFVGTNVVDRALDIAPGDTKTIAEAMTAVAIRTDQPLTLVCNAGALTFAVNQIFIADFPITDLVITAVAQNVNNAAVHLSYLG